MRDRIARQRDSKQGQDRTVTDYGAGRRRRRLKPDELVEYVGGAADVSEIARDAASEFHAAELRTLHQHHVAPVPTLRVERLNQTVVACLYSTRIPITSRCGAKIDHTIVYIGWQ